MSNTEKKDLPRYEKEEKHLTSDIHIRYRGHASEMIPPKNEHLDTNMPYRDIHDIPKEVPKQDEHRVEKIVEIPHHEPVKTIETPGEKHLTSDIHIRYRGHPSEMIPPENERLDTNIPFRDIHDNLAYGKKEKSKDETK